CPHGKHLTPREWPRRLATARDRWGQLTRACYEAGVRTLTSVLGNSQRLDGGAMFGNAPKAMWEKWIPPDDKNRIPLACRCLVVRDDDRITLLEAGMGAVFEPALRERFGVVEDKPVLLDSLAAVGIAPA